MHCLSINFKQLIVNRRGKQQFYFHRKFKKRVHLEKKADFGPKNLTKKLKYLPLLGIKFTPSITNKTRVHQNPGFLLLMKKPAGRF